MAGTNDKVKIALITGYLGAGKTTLLNHILSNDEGIRAAVIVNDIGEVNVDASLIKAGGFSMSTDSIIPLTNGCICCSLSDDLAKQLDEIASSGNFDYIVIEASGICEPIPIAYTISAFCDRPDGNGAAPLVLDNVIAVVDCARMLDEFDNGRALLEDDIDEEDIESLLIQQIEFCTTLVLNKTDCVTPEELSQVKAIVRGLQKQAVIVESQYGDVPLDQLLNTGRFNFEDAYRSAAWVDAMEHPEEHEEPEALEYGISTFVYRRRKPFDVDMLAGLVQTWPRSVIRAKGTMWTTMNLDMCYLFEQAGSQLNLSENGLFVDSAPADEKARILEANPELLDNWDPVCGDRETQICFIGRGMDRESIESSLDGCLIDWQGEA